MRLIYLHSVNVSVCEILFRQRLVEIITLYLITAKIFQNSQLFGSFNAFRHTGNVKIAADIDNVLYYRSRPAVMIYVAYYTAVKL